MDRRKLELLDLIPLLLSLITPIIIIIMVNKGIEIEFTAAGFRIIPYTEIFPAWSLVFFFGGWYVTLIVINWMILEYKQKLYKGSGVTDNMKGIKHMEQKTLDQYAYHISPRNGGSF